MSWEKAAESTMGYMVATQRSDQILRAERGASPLISPGPTHGTVRSRTAFFLGDRDRVVQVSHAVRNAFVRTSPDDLSLLLAGMSSV